LKVTLKDYKNDVKPDWCAGCGDFSVLAGINRAVVVCVTSTHAITAFFILRNSYNL